MKIIRKIKRALGFKAREQTDSAALEHMLGIIRKRPLSLNLETTTVCNSRCCFCAYPKVRRKTEHMSMDLFKKILDDYRELGGGPLGFSPLLSDPLMDPFLLERIRIAADDKHDFWLHMFTNGIGFSNFHDDDMKVFSLLDYINISMGGPDRDGYKSMFCVDKFDAVVKNLARLHSEISRSGSNTKISMHFRVVDRDAMVSSELYRRCLDFGFICNDTANEFSTFGGMVTQDDVPSGVVISRCDDHDRKEGCLIPFTTCAVCPNGDVVMCSCFDYSGRTMAGNLSESGIADVWKNDRYESFRTSFSRGEIPDICSGCALYWPSEKILGNKGLRNYDPGGDTFWNHLQ